ncbi:ArsR family transcriptional regulator [Corynebacterium crudilactis]|uniref:ArsR family transcriptional regulator n=2 Tax=Corynebacterium crudilactis TaxID=1652495 RepID=A0A172QX47_9CORY|nr:ArsR family transcriptional regulator [Corynebacterium crudilactis]
MGDETVLNELRQEIRDLAIRVASLESTTAKEQPDQADSESSIPQTNDDFWALSGLRSRLGEHASTEQGAVTLVGAVTLPTGAPVSWQQTAGTTGLFEIEWEERATAFAALGHPMRLELLRHILSGIHSTAELTSIESLGTTGQLHHHLRQLLSSGWLKQSGRGSYEVPPARVVPLLACIVASDH